MKVHSDTLTTDDLYAALPADVGVAHLRDLRNPRKRARGWDLGLEGFGGRHTRRANGGNYGAGNTMAATWDDYGVWMDRLYAIDPDAVIAWYNNREDFRAKTRHESKWRQRSRLRAVREYGRAPWLNNPA